MANEACRVLEKGGKAGFVIWGRTEETLIFTVMAEIMKKYEIAKNYSGGRTPNYLGENPTIPRDMLLKAGFSSVKYWYEPGNMSFATGEEAYNFHIIMP